MHTIAVSPEIKAQLITQVICACIAADYTNERIEKKVSLLVDFLSIGEQ